MRKILTGLTEKGSQRPHFLTIALFGAGDLVLLMEILSKSISSCILFRCSVWIAVLLEDRRWKNVYGTICGEKIN